jgi:hypothetical protein
MRSNVRWSIGLLLAVFAVALLSLATADRQAAAQPAKKVPAGVELVPSEGFAVLSINAAKLHDAEALKPVRDALEKGDKAMLKRIEEDYGLTLDQLDRVTFYWAEPTYAAGFEGAAAFVTTRKPIDKAKLLKVWKGSVEPKNGFGPGFGQFGNLAFAGGGVGFAGGGLAQLLPAQPPGVELPVAKPGEEAKPKPLDLTAPFYYCGTYGETVIVPIDDKTVVLLPSSSYNSGPTFVASLLRRKSDGPLAEALALTDKHDVVFAAQGKGLRQQVQFFRNGFGGGAEIVIDGFPGGPGGLLPVQPPGGPDAPPKVEDDFTPYEPLFEFDRAVLTFDLGATTKLSVTAHFPTDEAAKKAEPVAKEAIKSALAALTEVRKATAADAAEKDWLPPLDFALAGLKAAKVSQTGKTLTATATSDIGADLKAALVTLPTKLQETADRMRLANNLKQIGLALHNYHDANGRLPKDVTDGEGKVLMSWRVQLLPYLEENDLYARIDQTKAWDDPANKKLWDEMPAAFKIPSRAAKEKHETYFQTFRTVNWLGKDDPWQVDNHNVTLTEVTDGTATTAAVFEMEEAVCWMKPDGPTFDPKKLPAIGNPKTGKAAVLMLDGSVRTLDAKKYTGGKLAAVITVNGADEVDADDFK